MYTSRFLDFYSRDSHKINMDSPEVAFMQAVCKGKVNVEDYFVEKTIYKRVVILDAPSGRYENLKGIKRFCDEWLRLFQAKRADIHVAIQTIACGRAVSELEVWFELDEEIYKVPMVVICDLATPKLMEGLRIYYFYKWQPGCSVYRKPIFRLEPNVNGTAELQLMNGIIRYYYEQLHNYKSDDALENIMNMMDESFAYGGYRPEELEKLTTDKKEIYKIYQGIVAGIPNKGYVRFMTFTDDGRTCCTEWTTVVNHEGQKEGSVSIAGIAMYDRNEDGKLSSIRICDNAGFLDEVDVSAVNPEDIFVKW